MNRSVSVLVVRVVSVVGSAALSRRGCRLKPALQALVGFAEGGVCFGLVVREGGSEPFRSPLGPRVPAGSRRS